MSYQVNFMITFVQKFLFMKKLIIVLFTLAARFSFSQTEADSLEERLSSAGNDEKISICIRLSKLFSNDPEKATYYGLIADSLAELLGKQAERIEALSLAGNAYSDLGDNSKAIELHILALTIAKKLNDRTLLANAHNNLGVDYQFTGDFNSALSHFLSSVSIKEEKLPSGETVGTPKSIASTLSNIGVTYDDLGEYNKALEYYQRSLQIQIEIDYKKGIGSTLNNIGVIYEEKGDYPLALDYYRRALVLRRESGDSAKVAATLLNMGIIYLDMGDYAKALEYHFQSLRIADKNEDIYHIANISNSIADIYLEKNQPDSAFPFIQRGLETAKNIDAKKLTADSYRFLAKYYMQKGNYKKSAEAQQELLILKDSLFKIDLNEKVAEMQTRYETEKKQKEIELLTKDTEIKQLEIDKQKNRQILFFALAGFVMITTLFIFTRYRLRQRNLRIGLEKKNLETEQKLLRTQMNPHFIFNSLNSVQGYISANNSFLAMTYLAKFAKLMRYILENSRKNMILLEDEINALTLNMELERIRFKENFDFKIVTDDDLDPAALFIPPMLIQPFIENAMKHGLRNKEGKGLLEIAFKPSGKLILCTVKDNGIGREKAMELNKAKDPAHKSVGMEVTSERLAVLRQEFGEDISVVINDLKNQDGTPAGTEVELKIPYESE
jgi:tetratricopeptide (TPR) repeat protein